jgi:BASS family bile acid:Na+ symporter
MGMKTIAHFFSRFMALIVLAVAALALFVPSSGLWISLKAVNYLLMVVMFGMGLTMKLDDFKVVFTQPKDVLIGCLAQFTVMPLLAFSLGKIFGLEAGLLAGVILVGTCPGGTSSNVITYMSKGNVALSVGMTSVNTLLSPIVTPAITYLLLRTSVKVDMLAMCLSILQVVILPIALGFVVNKFAKKFVAKVIDILPVVSVIAICLIVSTVVSHNAEKILTTGAIVFVVVILHNLLGYACGFGLGKVLKMDMPKTKALTVEIGMQNSGLATSLANTAFPSFAMATVPGAIFSVWHNISGAILANILRNRE